MVYRIFFLTIALFLTISATSYSQIKLPDVTSPIVQKIPVYIPSFNK